MVVVGFLGALTDERLTDLLRVRSAVRGGSCRVSWCPDR